MPQMNLNHRNAPASTENVPKHAYERYVNPQAAGLLNDLGLAHRFLRGEGTTLFDAEGVEYLDGISQFGALPFGYNPPQIWDAIESVRTRREPNFVQPSILDAAGALAERLLRHTPGLSRVTYCNSGAEAVEAAIKIARSATGRRTIVSARGGYHGKTLGALAATGREEYQKAFGPPAEGFVQVAYADASAVAEALDSGDDVAAVLLEPVQGEGGVIVPPEGYLAEVAEICRARGVLLLVDEVQTGLGRTGVMFSSIAQGVTPDVLIVAKALGGGLMPIGACLSREEVYSREFALKHSSTFAGGALACRAGIAALDLLEENDGALLRSVRSNGERMLKELRTLASEFPHLIRDVRGNGHLIGLELAVDRHTWRESLPGYFAEQGLLGYLICGLLMHHEAVRLAPNLNGGKVLRVQPALIASHEECTRLVDALRRTFARLAGGRTADFLAHLLGDPETPLQAVEPKPAARRSHRSRAARPVHRFAFLLHPLDTASLCDLDSRLGAFSMRQLEDLKGRIQRQAGPFRLSRARVESPTGAVAEGSFYLLPHCARSLQGMRRRSALRLVEQTLDLAMEERPEIIGLGAYTSVVSANGRLFKRRNLPALTAGSILTAVSGEISVRRAMARRGLDPRRTTTAIVGAAGSIGSMLTLSAAAHSKRLILIGNPAGGEKSQLKVRKRMIAAVAELQRARPTKLFSQSLQGRILSSLKKPAEIVDELEARGSATFTVSLADASCADVIYTATSCPEALGDPSLLPEDAIVCELSRPFNLRGAGAEIELIEGGVIDLPGEADLGFNPGLERGRAFACMAETMLLALEGRFDLPLTSSRLSLDTIETIRRAAQTHDFHVSRQETRHGDATDLRVA